MAMTAAELVKADQDHLIHPLHHPIDNAEPMIYVRGRGAMVTDIGGHELPRRPRPVSGTSTSATAAPSWPTRRRPR